MSECVCVCVCVYVYVCDIFLLPPPPPPHTQEALQCLKDPTNVLFEDQHTLVLHSFMNIGE